MNNKKILFRDFVIVNIAGISGLMVLFLGILLKEWHYIPDYQCAFLQATHMYCPGCGGTRALFALVKGDVLRSFLCNPAVVLGVLIILYYEITVVMTIFGKKGRTYYTKSSLPVYVFLIIVLGYSIVRDILLVVFGIDFLA